MTTSHKMNTATQQGHSFQKYSTTPADVDSYIKQNQGLGSQWEEQDYGGLEVNQNQPNEIDVYNPHSVEADLNRTPQYVEQDLHAAPNVGPYSSEATAVHTDAGGTLNDGAARKAQSHQEAIRTYGIPRKWFWVPIASLAIVVIGAAVGGGIGGNLQAHKNDAAAPVPMNPTSPTNSPDPIKSSPIFQNSSIAAVQWRDDSSSDNKQYRVYFQAKEGAIMEASWASGNSKWIVSTITDEGADIELGTPITAAVGYPHVNTSYALAKNVYYVSNLRTIFERESPSLKDPGQLWGYENFSGQRKVSVGSSLSSFWHQSLEAESQILAILYQDRGLNSLSISKYAATITQDNPWVSTEQSFTIQDGSPIAFAPTGNRLYHRLYVGNTDGTLVQYQYNLTNHNISNPTSTIFELKQKGYLTL